MNQVEVNLKASIVFLFLLIANSAIAQLSSLGPHFKIDSLKAKLLTDKEDSIKVMNLVFLSRELSVQNSDTALAVAREAVLLANKLNWKRGMGYSAIGLGWAHYVKADYNLALEANYKGLKVGEETEDKTIVLMALSNIGQNYFSLGDAIKAIEYNTKALKIAEQQNDQWNIARNTGIIGISYNLLKNYTTALQYYFKAYELTEKIGNKNGSAVWLSNIGVVYMESKDYSKAIYYSEKAAAIFDSLGNKWTYAQTILDIGKIYFSLKQYEKSYQYLVKAYRISSKVGALDDRKEVYLSLSKLYKESNINLPDSLGTVLLSPEAMRLQALNYYQTYILFRDSIINLEQQKKSLSLEFDSKTAFTKAEQEKKDVIAEQQLQKQKIIRNSFIAGSILLLLLIVVLINRHKLKRVVEMEKMRSRLSRDLHDDIGSTLSSINILSRTAQNNLVDTSDERTKASLEKINERSQRLLDSISDIIWNINPGNDTIEEVMSRMREYASTIMEAKNIDYTFNFPKEKLDCTLTMEVKNNMYLIFKEAVNNLSKYSGATHATLSLTFDEKSIYLIVEDNGKGFNDSEIKHRSGLSNMQHRAEEIKGSISIKTVAEKGTIIKLTMPRYC